MVEFGALVDFDTLRYSTGVCSRIRRNPKRQHGCQNLAAFPFEAWAFPGFFLFSPAFDPQLAVAYKTY